MGIAAKTARLTAFGASVLVPNSAPGFAHALRLIVGVAGTGGSTAAITNAANTVTYAVIDTDQVGDVELAFRTNDGLRIELVDGGAGTPPDVTFTYD